VNAPPLAASTVVTIYEAMSQQPDLHAIRRSVELVGRISDSLIRVGPFSLGIDGILDWIPGLGEVYSICAAGVILIQGYRAGVPLSTLALAGAMMAGRTAITAIPLAGPLAADLFTAHRFAARMVIAAIDRRLADQGDSPLRSRAPMWRTRGAPISI
jgi:hypothetical protein